MVSGIGPRETLDGLGIAVLSDRPGVGQNMWVCYSALNISAKQGSTLCSVSWVYRYILFNEESMTNSC